MSKPNFFRFKRKVTNTNDAPVAKQAKKDGKIKGQTAISKFFLPTKQSSHDAAVKDDSGESSMVATKDFCRKENTSQSTKPAEVKQRSIGLGQHTLDKLRRFSSSISNSNVEIEKNVGGTNANIVTENGIVAKESNVEVEATTTSRSKLGAFARYVTYQYYIHCTNNFRFLYSSKYLNFYLWFISVHIRQ